MTRLDSPNIRFQTVHEFEDVQAFMEELCKDQRGGDPFWVNSAKELLTGVMLHLMYKHNREGRLQPTLADVEAFFYPYPDMSITQLLESMKTYPHITAKKFLEIEGRRNPLKAIYGDYITNLEPYKRALSLEPDTADRNKIGHMDDLRRELIPRAGKKPSRFFLERPWKQLLVHPKVARCAENMLRGAEQTRASIWEVATSLLHQS